MIGSRGGVGAGANLHSDHVKTRCSELVQDLDGVALGANRADLMDENRQLASITHTARSSPVLWSYNGGSTVVLGGLEGSVERGEPVDSATKGEVVKSSGHLVSWSDGFVELGSSVFQGESSKSRAKWWEGRGRLVGES